MKLYELSTVIRELMADCDDRGGELTDDDLCKLDELTADIDYKVDAICRLVREDDAHAVAKQAEVDRLKAGIAVHRNRAERLKKYLHACLQLAGLQRVDTELFRVHIQRSPASVQPTVDVANLPAEFQRVKVEPDCEKARDYWKLHGEPPEGFEVNQGTHLRIR